MATNLPNASTTVSHSSTGTNWLSHLVGHVNKHVGPQTIKPQCEGEGRKRRRFWKKDVPAQSTNHGPGPTPPAAEAPAPTPPPADPSPRSPTSQRVETGLSTDGPSSTSTSRGNTLSSTSTGSFSLGKPSTGQSPAHPGARRRSGSFTKVLHDVTDKFHGVTDKVMDRLKNMKSSKNGSDSEQAVQPSTNREHVGPETVPLAAMESDAAPTTLKKLATVDEESSATSKLSQDVSPVHEISSVHKDAPAFPDDAAVVMTSALAPQLAPEQPKLMIGQQIIAEIARRREDSRRFAYAWESKTYPLFEIAIEDKIKGNYSVTVHRCPEEGHRIAELMTEEYQDESVRTSLDETLKGHLDEEFRDRTSFVWCQGEVVLSQDLPSYALSPNSTPLDQPPNEELPGGLTAQLSFPSSTNSDKATGSANDGLPGGLTPQLSFPSSTRSDRGVGSANEDVQAGLTSQLSFPSSSEGAEAVEATENPTVPDDEITAPRNPGRWDPPFMGDSAGQYKHKNAATLGPMVRVKGHKCWVVNFHTFDDAQDDGIRTHIDDALKSPPGDLQLTHPGHIDDDNPDILGRVIAYSGRMYWSFRESRSMKEFCEHKDGPAVVSTDWALCACPEAVAEQLAGRGDLPWQNRLRAVPVGIEFESAYAPVQKIFDRDFASRLVQATGRTSGYSYAMVCETPAAIRRGGKRHKEWFVSCMPGWSPEPEVEPEEWWKFAGLGIFGDSGAPIVDIETNELVGQVWGRNRYGGRRRARRVTYFTAMMDIFDDVVERYPHLGPVDMLIHEPCLPQDGAPVPEPANASLASNGPSGTTNGDDDGGSASLQPPPPGTGWSSRSSSMKKDNSRRSSASFPANSVEMNRSQYSSLSSVTETVDSAGAEKKGRVVPLPPRPSAVRPTAGKLIAQ